jgi:hypothetical protein
MKKQQKISQVDEHLDQGQSTMMTAIAAGEDRIKWLLSCARRDLGIGSFQIVMDFDEDGHLNSYWECSFDEKGKELIGGGIDRVEAPERGSTIS